MSYKTSVQNLRLDKTHLQIGQIVFSDWTNKETRPKLYMIDRK